MMTSLLIPLEVTKKMNRSQYLAGQIVSCHPSVCNRQVQELGMVTSDTWELFSSKQVTVTVVWQAESTLYSSYVCFVTTSVQDATHAF